VYGNAVYNARCISLMGWLPLVGSIKIYVSFAEYRLFYRALLQKRPLILRSLLIVATPYCLLPYVSYKRGLIYETRPTKEAYINEKRPLKKAYI